MPAASRRSLRPYGLVLLVGVGLLILALVLNLVLSTTSCTSSSSLAKSVCLTYTPIWPFLTVVALALFAVGVGAAGLIYHGRQLRLPARAPANR